MMRHMAYRTGMLSVAHFLVDFSCAFLLFRRFLFSGDWMLALLLYNFCAFALQLPIGILADWRGKSYPVFAALGCALVALSYLLPWALAASVLAGCGNGLFHVGGGCEVMASSPRRAAPLGVFVAPGAFGIYLGTLLGKGERFSPWICALALLAAGVLCLARSGGAPIPDAVKSSCGRHAAPAAVALFLVVLLRSWAGFQQGFSWKTGLLAAAASACTVLGKAAGGFLSDRFGLRRAGCISLLGAAALFCFGEHAPAGLAAIFLFNLTMPMTLHALSLRWPQWRGTAFGLLTFALFLGFLPQYFSISLPGTKTLWLCTVSLVSLVLYLPAAGRNNGE